MAQHHDEQMSSTVADGLLTLLKREGIRHVFGIPGGGIYPLFRAIEDDRDFTLIVSHHESAGAFMADGFARVSTRIGEQMAAVAVTSGPGAVNVMNGVAGAYTEGVPMLVITGQAPSCNIGKGAAQETSPEDIDIVGMFRPITKFSAHADSAEKLAHNFHRALRAARSGRPGPVHLNVPVDLWSRPMAAGTLRPGHTGTLPTHFDRAAVRAAAAALVAARHPIFLVGSGTANGAARPHLLALAEQVNALAATTPRAKGLFPETAPRSLGVLGLGGHISAKRVFLGRQADVLFIIGASMNEPTTFNWDPRLAQGRTVIQLDIDPDVIGRNYPVDIPLLGDYGAISAELLHAVRSLRESGAPSASQWSPRDYARWDEEHFINQANRRAKAEPLTPERWRVELQEALPPDAILFSDIGGHMLFNLQHLRIGPEQLFVLGLDYGSMGHGTAAPIGAALAQPHRPILSIVGDSCFFMHGMEVLTASEHGLPVKWIVENNGCQGIVLHGGRLLSNGRTLACVRSGAAVDFASFARAMGVAFWRVTSAGQIAPAVREALAHAGPALIEVVADAEVMPPMGERIEAISSFRV